MIMIKFREYLRQSSMAQVREHGAGQEPVRAGGQGGRAGMGAHLIEVIDTDLRQVGGDPGRVHRAAPVSRRCLLATIFGSKLESRSRGTESSTGWPR